MILDDVVQAFIDDGTTVIANYGHAFEQEEVDIASKSANVVRLLTMPFFESEEEFMKDSDGLISQGVAIATTIALKDKVAVSKSQDWLQLLYNSPNSGLGKPGTGPTTFQGVKFWRWMPEGGNLVNIAQKWGGKYWVVEQPIEFAAETI